jgi:hypothetical protein
MTMRAMKFWLPVVVLAFFPAVAHADAGTPLLWAGAFHLLLGNAIIGVAEGLILALLFRLKAAVCIPVMIAANYFSAWVGGVLVMSQISSSLSLDLYNARRWLWCLVAVSYIITLVLEWPFIAFCLRGTNGWFRKSLWGSLVVQTASYLVLFAWYWAASGKTLYTELAIVQPSEISLPKDAMLYYLDENGRDVCVCDLGDGQTRKIDELKLSATGRWLLLQESRRAAGRWDLIAESEEQSPAEDVVIADMDATFADPPCVGLRPGGTVPRFGGDKSGWRFQFGWMAGRLDGENDDGRRVDLSLETPFVRWPVQCPTQLPSGHVIFQLGASQICILDPDKRKVALLAKGRWPVVTLKDGGKQL